MKKETTVIIFLIGILFLINYQFLDSVLINNFDSLEKGIIERVVDGDTLVVSGEKVRLLGINSPEKGEAGYDEAKAFLEKFNGTEVYLEYGKEKYDLYKRKLAYVFYSGENLNLESVRQGYSNPYFPKGKDKYYSLFFEVWDSCLEEGINLCEFVKEECLVFDWKPNEDYFSIKNNCYEKINLKGYSVKDEGRKKYVFSEKFLEKGEKVILNSDDWGKSYVWTKPGDSIFVRNSENKLIYFDSY